MQVTTEQIDPCKTLLTISVEPERVAEAKEKAFQQLLKGIQLPGFRKGKVPAAMGRPYVDEGKIRQKAAESLIDPAYSEAVAESGVEPFAEPQVEFVSMDDDAPFVFKAFVPLRPQVTLGPYKGLSLEKRRLLVTDADVDRQIDEIRARQAQYPEVTDRPAQMGDVVLADLTASIDGQETPELDEPRATVIEIGKNIADFDNGLVGMSIGDTKTIDALYPENFENAELAGKRAQFTVTIKEIRTREMPELTDEFVQKIHPTAQNADELRVAVRETLDRAAEEMAQNDLDYRLIGEIVKNSTIHFPEVLLTAEMQEDARQLTERLERDKISVPDYLAQTGQTVEQVQAQFAEAAGGRIRNSLVLSEVARTEGLQIEDADVDAKIAERAERAKVSPAAVRAYAEKNNQMDAFRNQALTEKILGYLKDQSAITERSVTGDELRALDGDEAETDVVAVATELEDEEAETAEAAAPLALQGSTTARRKGKVVEAVTEDAAPSVESEAAGNAEDATA